MAELMLGAALIDRASAADLGAGARAGDNDGPSASTRLQAVAVGARSAGSLVATLAGFAIYHCGAEDAGGGGARALSDRAVIGLCSAVAASAAVLGCWLPDTRVAGRRALPRTDNADAALAADSVADRGALCALSALLCLILPLLATGCWVSMRPVLSAGAWAGGMAALLTLDGLVYVALPLAAHAAGAAPRCRAPSASRSALRERSPPRSPRRPPAADLSAELLPRGSEGSPATWRGERSSPPPRRGCDSADHGPVLGVPALLGRFLAGASPLLDGPLLELCAVLLAVNALRPTEVVVSNFEYALFERELCLMQMLQLLGFLAVIVASAAYPFLLSRSPTRHAYVMLGILSSVASLLRLLPYYVGSGCATIGAADDVGVGAPRALVVGPQCARECFAAAAIAHLGCGLLSALGFLPALILATQLANRPAGAEKDAEPSADAPRGSRATPIPAAQPPRRHAALRYALLITCLDLGDTLNYMVAAPIVDALGIAPPTFGHLPAFVAIQASAGAAVFAAVGTYWWWSWRPGPATAHWGGRLAHRP